MTTIRAAITEPSSRRAAGRKDLRQAIASLLRLADADARDARMLAEAGGTRNAAGLLRSAISRLIEAVVASEQGDIGPPDIRRIDRRHPLRPDLLRLDGLFATPFSLRRDGRLPEPPAAASLLPSLDQLAGAMERVVQHCGVDLKGTGPAETAEPLRPLAEPKPPSAPAPAPDPGRRQAKPARRPPAGGQAGSDAATASRKPAASAPRPPGNARARAPEPAGHAAHHAGLTSSTFWALADRWLLSDLEALQLIGHAGGLTRKGTRPRFKLKDNEAEVVAAMASLDAALTRLGFEPATWLSEPLRPEPFQGAAPLDLIQKAPLHGLRDVGRFLTQMGFRLSLQDGSP